LSAQISSKSQAPNIKQGPNGETASSKSQAPNIKQDPNGKNGKFQTRRVPNQQVRFFFLFFVWNLLFGPCLLFGACDLEFACRLALVTRLSAGRFGASGVRFV
jgi:hypothetical protein